MIRTIEELLIAIKTAEKQNATDGLVMININGDYVKINKVYVDNYSGTMLVKAERYEMR